MFHLKPHCQKILTDHRMSWRYSRLAGIRDDKRELIKEEGVRAIIVDLTTRQPIITRDLRPCSSENIEAFIESVVEEIPSFEKPKTPAEMALELQSKDARIKELEAQVKAGDAPAPKRKTPAVLTTMLIERELAIPSGKRTTNAWKDEAQRLCDEYDKTGNVPDPDDDRSEATDVGNLLAIPGQVA